MATAKLLQICSSHCSRPRHGRSDLSGLAITLVCILLAVLFTAILINHSIVRGRLANPPLYDDTVYLADGAKRLNDLYTGGFQHLLSSYTSDPPHSPFSAFLAMTGFLVFGLHEWAPYAMNGLLAVAYLLFVNHLLHGVRAPPKIACSLFLFSVPLCGYAVTEFRPDHACALATSAGCFLLLQRPFLTAGFRRVALIGSLFGLAFLIKPSTSPATLVIFFATLFLAAVTDWLTCKPVPTAKAGIIRIVLTVLLSIGIAMVYYSVGWSQTVGYIREVMFGAHKSVWRTPGSASFHLTYYLTGLGGTAMLGNMLWFLIVPPALVAAIYIRRRRRSEIVRAAAFVLLVGGTFVIAAANQTKSAFLGLTFQTSLLLLAFLSLRQLLVFNRLHHPHTPWASVLVVLLVACGVLNFTWPLFGTFQEHDPGLVRARHDLIYSIYDTIVASKPPVQSRILVVGIGAVTPEAYDFFSIRDGHRLQFFTLDSPDLADYLSAVQRSDYVILSERETGCTATYMLQYQMLDPLLAHLRSNAAFEQLAYVPFSDTGKGFRIFSRKAKDGFAPGMRLGGFGPIEGPYPQWNLPLVRWSHGSESTITVSRDRAMAATFHARFTTPIPDLTVQILLNDVLLHTHVVPDHTVSQDVMVPVELASGDNTIRLVYSRTVSIDGLPRAALFRAIRIVPSPPVD
jgi:hypothetical protein